jgi:hypothetical protein
MPCWLTMSLARSIHSHANSRPYGRSILICLFACSKPEHYANKLKSSVRPSVHSLSAHLPFWRQLTVTGRQSQITSSTVQENELLFVHGMRITSFDVPYLFTLCGLQWIKRHQDRKVEECETYATEDDMERCCFLSRT